MSRIGKLPVVVPDGVQLSLNGNTVQVKGAKGELTYAVPSVVKIAMENGKVQVSPADGSKQAKAMHGTVRSLIQNMIEGVSKGYSRALEIQGVGFRAQAQGQKLTLSLGYSHPIDYELPASIQVKVQDGTQIEISGPDKQLVGQVSARIRSFYPAEPYKGKGVRYKDEYVRRKAGKAVA